MTQLARQLRPRDKEMVPGFLVKAMFALMFASVSIVAFAQWTNQPQVGVLEAAPIAVSKDIILTGDRNGFYRATDTEGVLLATSDDARGGFLGVMGRAIDRERQMHNVAAGAPIQVIRRENGNIAVVDPTTDMSIELIGYGADNVAAFAQFVN